MGVHWHRHRDSQRPLSEQRRRIGGIVGGGEPPKKILLEDGKYYLISDNKIPQGRYIAIQASVDEDNVIYASISLNDNNKINLYDINGRIVSFVDATDNERIELENSISADIADYNGQFVVFENENSSYEGEQFTIIDL